MSAIDTYCAEHRDGSDDTYDDHCIHNNAEDGVCCWCGGVFLLPEPTSCDHEHGEYKREPDPLASLRASMWFMAWECIGRVHSALKRAEHDRSEVTAAGYKVHDLEAKQAARERLWQESAANDDECMERLSADWCAAVAELDPMRTLLAETTAARNAAEAEATHLRTAMERALHDLTTQHIPDDIDNAIDGLTAALGPGPHPLVLPLDGPNSAEQLQAEAARYREALTEIVNVGFVHNARKLARAALAAKETP